MSSLGQQRWLAALTILAIAGTLSSCGRYGRPVRPTPENAKETEEAEAEAKAKPAAVDSGVVVEALSD